MNPTIKPKPIILLKVQAHKTCCAAEPSETPGVDACCAPAKDQFQGRQLPPPEDAGKTRYRIEIRRYGRESAGGVQWPASAA